MKNYAIGLMRQNKTGFTMDCEKSLNPQLLEEVFNEVENLEGSAPREPDSATKLVILDDSINFEKETLPDICKFLKKANLPQEFNFMENIKEEESVVHEGLTDSSEDEDNKYFEKGQYSECGRNLRTLIKQKNGLTPKTVKVSKAEDLWTKSKIAGKKLTTELENLSRSASASGPSIEKDPILGMNIVNPLVSSIALKEKLTGRVSVSTSKVKQFLETPASKDLNWVTGGAIVSKLVRTSQKGNQYCVWHVTDLRDDIKTVSIFLFGSAYREYWKTSLGTVVSILNPVVMERDERSEATLRVDNAQKVLLIGVSKDYGICKSKKKNGENCSAVVNKSKCEYCIYHVKKAYNKACRRTDLQPPKIGRNLDGVKARVSGKNQFFTGRRTFTGIVAKQSSEQLKKDKQRMELLSRSGEFVADSQKTKPGIALKMLSQGPEDIPQRMTKNKSTPNLPTPESQMIDLGFTISKNERHAAKIKALKYVREHGSLKKLIDKDRPKKNAEQISSIKRKLQTEEESENKKLKVQIANPLKEKHFKNGLTEEFLKLMNSEVRNDELMKVAESEEREKYFSKLEMREKMENKMASTFKMECKAVRCLKCNYKTFSASDICKKEKHPLKVVNAVKRFWKCGDCAARTICLELVPLHSCKVCGSSKWERASMMPERKDGNVTRTPLSLRGDEEKFLGASSQQANLNLLVPEENP